MKRCDDCPNHMACEQADVCLHSSGRIPPIQACPIDPELLRLVTSMPPIRKTAIWENRWEDFPPTA